MLNRLRFLVFTLLLLLLVFIKPQFIHSQDVKTGLPIPKAIVAEAKRRLIPLTAIRLSGKKWIACVENLSHGESCITLGDDVPSLSGDDDIKRPNLVDSNRSISINYGDQVSIERFGHQSLEIPVLPGPKLTSSIAEFGTLIRTGESLRFEIRNDCEARINVTGRSGRRTLDALPRFRRESSRLVRTTDLEVVSKYLSQQLDEPFLVVVTVPSHCEPCRRMDQVISKYHESEQPGVAKVKTFILEYFSFSDAEDAVLGSGAVFPTIIVFPRYSELRKSSLPSLAIGFSQVSGIEAISKRLESGFKRSMPSGIARGALSLESLHGMLRTAD